MLQPAAESPAYHLYSPAPKQLSSFKLNTCVCVCCDICQAVPAAPGIVQNVMTGEQLKQQVASQQLWPTVQQTGMFQSQDAAGSSVQCIVLLVSWNWWKTMKLNLDVHMTQTMPFVIFVDKRNCSKMKKPST